MISQELFKTDTIYKTIGADYSKGHFACGFMNKTLETGSSLNIVSPNYSGVLLLHGKGEFIDSIGNKTPLHAGCYVQRLPNIRHSTIVDTDSNWLEFFINISQESFFTLSQMSIFDYNRPILYPDVNPYLIKRLIDFHNKMKMAGTLELPPLLFQAFDIIFDIHKMDRNNLLNKEEEVLVENGCKLLENKTCFHYNIEEISKQLNIGYEYFRKIFKRHTGISPRQYQINKRIDYAIKMLTDGNHSITIIAQKIGYPDIFSFSKQFKKVTGISPRNFFPHTKQTSPKGRQER